RVMVERFARAAQAAGDGGRLLAITFTERATAELVDRVAARVPELLGESGEPPWVSTIHGFCARLLRANALTAGIDPAFSILDEAGAEELRSTAFASALDGLIEQHGEAAVDLAAAYRIAGLRQT